ncbi:hypothetical protein UAS_00569 [Enterococcus asini ATCC 700915]|uniref:Uncharacterized protein n=1 Tax=Enterococcus asini ATCC 700915 TaxID=1158606 RepID=R2S200_9ENTE|nr:hypothetical protein UAS_00569 [Enterococcus asini ATCC 700915]EOT56526.1 hypothetical protein I579_00025 [Enterococcus asini ATCC 700915]
MSNFTGKPNPMKMKLFRSGGPIYQYVPGSSPRRPDLEKMVNEFLAENPDRAIFHIKQSTTAIGDNEDFQSETTISIWYQD